jgi:hypothetical protein
MYTSNYLKKIFSKKKNFSNKKKLIIQTFIFNFFPESTALFHISPQGSIHLFKSNKYSVLNTLHIS